MARRYDARTTIFSPEGRLYQVEYAMEAIGNAGAAMGLIAKDGVVLVAEKKITSKAGLHQDKPSCHGLVVHNRAEKDYLAHLAPFAMPPAAPRHQRCRSA
jgi:hypothetical protein